MKKIVGLIIGTCIIFSSMAVNADGPTSFYYDEQWHTYNEEPVHVLVNGEEVNGDMPPILLNDSTLVPARAVFEKMGATVTWDEAKSQVGIVMDNINLVLLVNDNKATVNGSVYEMRIPPKVINKRTMIPARFVAEALGMIVNWKENERVVSIDRGDTFIDNVQKSVEGSKLRITVSSDIPMTEYSSFEIQDNPRVVIDVKNAILKYSNGDLIINNGYVNKIRFGQNSIKPNITRIVADLNIWVGYTISLSPDKKQMYIDFDCSPSEISNVKFTKTDNNESIDFNMKYDRNISMYSIGDGRKINIDIPMAALKDIKGSIIAAGNIIKSVEANQYENMVKLVIDTHGPCVAEISKGDTGAKVTFSPISSRRLVYSFDGKPAITINSEYSGINYFNYSYKYLNENGNFTLSVPKNSIPSGFAKVFINDGYINDISIVPNASTGTTDLIFEAKLPLTYAVDSVSVKDRITVTAGLQTSTTPGSRGPNDSMKDKVIVIDPGHGGQEGGAVFTASNGNIIKEKDINLSISLKLYDLLKKAGMKVYMTRMDDSTVGLYERADFANNLNASLFVSVHNNAGGYAAQNGTMTLFYPSIYNKSYGITGERFAQIAQEEMLLQLGTNNLGLWKRPMLAVLNTAKMPAILAEVSYLTNDTDRANLANDAFKAKAAQALYYSIIRALDEAQTSLKNQVPVVTQPLPTPQWRPEDYITRNIYGFAVPSLATSKCDYSWRDAINLSWYDLSIKLDYSKEVNKKYTLVDQRKEAEQVLKSMLDEQTVAKIMEAAAYQKDYTSYIWEDEIETSVYKIWIRGLKNTGVFTIDVMKK